MNKSSSASSSTPLQQRPISSNIRNNRISPTTTTTTASAPAIIPLDYNYQTMSPSSLSQLRYDAAATAYHPHQHHQTRGVANTATSTNRGSLEVDTDIDNQYSSLFGDPVPPAPPADFLDTQHIYRPHNTSIEISSEEEGAFGRTITLDTARGSGGGAHMRLFSDIPYSSAFGRRLSNLRNFDVLPTTMPRLEPPDIQILPNSSGGSSAEQIDSPNYALLAPNDILRKPDLYDPANDDDDDETPPEAYVTELIETMTISDATGTREYSEATRRVSNFSEDFKSNVGSLSNNAMASDTSTTAAKSAYARQCSNESYSSNEWFRPASHDFPEFSKMPRMRPSSKNVMSIKRDEMPMHHSPVAAMINDSNGSSSGEERLMDTTQTLDHPTVSLDALSSIPERPPDPSPSRLRDFDSDLLLSPQEYLQKYRQSSVDSLGPNFPPPPLPAAPPPIPPAPFLDEGESETGKSVQRDISPVIMRDSIVTGGDYRVEQTRSHKKTSFTIISDHRSPQSSRAQSPTSHSRKQSLSTAPPSVHSSPTKPIAKPRYHLQHKSHSSTQLKLPHVTHLNQMATDDYSPRPSVQFNMSGRYSPSKMSQRGILHQRESLTSSQDTLPPAPMSRRRHSILPPTASLSLTDSQKMKSCEALPFITDPYRTAIPRLNRSSLDLRRESSVIPPGALPRPLKPNPNPTRMQRGLLKIVNGQDSLSRIPLRSKWTSMDDLTREEQQRRPSLSPVIGLKSRRRSSSTSPERRSSTQTVSDRRSSNLSSVTTSDFSFRRPSLTSTLPHPQPSARRKSILPSASPMSKRRQSLVAPSNLNLGSRSARTKIAKPSTLSPIIGTPNKDSSTPHDSPLHGAAHSLAASESLSDVTSRRDSLSKIPVRSSQPNSRPNSRMSSQPGSRSNSPLKEFTARLPLSGLTSRATSSRSPSRATVRSESQYSSRGNSRAPSRSTSRASTRAISRAPSRASSRPTSRMDQAKELANSRSNSRMSVHTGARAGSISPNAGYNRGTPTPTRRKSISLSPQGTRKSLVRRMSISPPSKKHSNSRGRGKKSRDQLDQRRNSRSRIPMRAKSGTRAATKSASKSTSPAKSRVPTSARESSTAKKISPIRSSGSGADESQRKKKNLASAKKAPGSVHKPESSVKRTPSSVGKQAAAVKKQPSNLQKTGSNLKREPSNLQKKPLGADATAKAVKREASSISMKKAGAGTGSETKKQTTAKSKSNDSKLATATKASDGSKVAAIAANQSGEATGGSAAISGSGGISGSSMSDLRKPIATAAAASAAATAIAASGSASGMKRQTSKKTLVRMASRMSLLSMKRSDSNLSSKKLTVPAVAEETTKNGDSNAHDKTSHLQKVNSSGQLITADDVAGLPAAILEKSQKTLENIQKTVTVATDEIQKTISENLTDLKSLETDMGRMSDSAASPTPSVTTVVENKGAGKSGGNGGGAGESASRTGTAEGAETVKGMTDAAGQQQKSPLPPTQPIEADVSVLNGKQTLTSGTDAGGGGSSTVGNAAVLAGERVSARAISVLPEVDSESANFQNYETTAEREVVAAAGSGEQHFNAERKNRAAAAGDSGDDFKTDAKRRSPDGQGGSTAGSGGNNGSREFLKEKDDDDDAGAESQKGCCRCCANFCMPCRRSRCSRCCQRSKKSRGTDESEEPVLSATSSATTTHLEVIDETATAAAKTTKAAKTSCWQKLNCCKRCRKKPKISDTMTAEEQTKMETIHEEHHHETSSSSPLRSPRGPRKQSKCGLCLSKIFCCRSVNKVDTTTGDETEVKKCCFCIPCRRKRERGSAVDAASVSGAGGTAAWQDPEAGITATDASVLEGIEATAAKQSCCKRFWNKVLCCRKKPMPVASDSRRASMKVPPPPAEDTRRKLHVDLIEFNSKMKGAIPVLPLYLAWFCAICNTVCPGLGTLFSGIFCLCVGIPRFSQYDSAKARFGSLIINIIVAVAQVFCVLFCFVGWGWSIWWGIIMLRCARKLSKIKKVERLEMEEEKRQAEAAAAAGATAIRATTMSAAAATTTIASANSSPETEVAKT